MATDKSSALRKNHELKMQQLRILIDEGDAAIAAGHVSSYDSPEELTSAIIG